MNKRILRSRRQKVLGGVAGGLAQYFGIDPVIVRVLFVIFTIFHGIGLLLYIILWVVIPEEPFEVAYNINPQANNAQPGSENLDPTFQFDANAIPEKKGSGRIIAGSILIIIGLLFFADNFIYAFDFFDIVPFVVLILGGLLIFSSLKK